MLRHDGSRPASHADRRKIKALSGEFAPDRNSIRNPVEIALVGPNKPNTARWESFQWAVPGDLDYQLVKSLRAQEIERQAQARKDDALRVSALAKLSPEERRVIESDIALARQTQ